MNREHRKKEDERAYVEHLARRFAWECHIVGTGPSERPDFVLHFARGPVGLEVRYVYADETPLGSPRRRIDRLIERSLNRIRHHFRAAGGPLARVEAELLTPVSEGVAQSLGRQLSREVKQAPLNHFVEITLSHEDQSMRALIQRRDPRVFDKEVWRGLPDPSLPRAVLTTEIVESAIRDKAARIPHYDHSDLVGKELLLVAEFRTSSGRATFDGDVQAVRLPPKSFDAVYLVEFPFRVRQLGSANAR